MLLQDLLKWARFLVSVEWSQLCVALGKPCGRTLVVEAPCEQPENGPFVLIVKRCTFQPLPNSKSRFWFSQKHQLFGW